MTCRDSNGTPVEFGDKIRVIFPEVDFVNVSPDGDEDYFFIPERIAEGIIKFQLSKGILIKITKIIKDDNGDLEVGKTRKLRYVAWKWYKIEEKVG